MKLPESIDLQELTASIRHSNEILRYTMDDRVKIIREVAGLHFSQGGTIQPIIVNLLALYQSIVIRSLITKNPKYDLSSFDEKLRSTLDAEKDWINQHIEKIDLSETLSRVIHDAFYPGGGWCKVSLATPCDAASQGWAVDAGEPYVRHIDFEDMIIDGAASRISESTFIGHWYLCPLEVAQKMYKRFSDQLQPVSDQDRDFNDQGIEKVGRVFRGFFGIKEFEQHVRLAEVYLPRHKLIVTLAEHDVLDKQQRVVPLWTQPWIGPARGPFVGLGYKTVIGSPIPGSPLGDLYDLHVVYNTLMRKIARQAGRIKENTVYLRRNSDEMELWNKAIDGQPIACENPEAVRDVMRGGTAIQILNAVSDVFKQLFMLMGGNLELLGGRQQEADTASQEKMLNQNAGSTLQDLSTETERFISRIGESLYWFHHHHPKNIMESHYAPKNSDIKGVVRKVYPPNPDVLKQHNIFPYGNQKARIRDFNAEDAQVRVVPYSYQNKTPQERLSFIRSTVNELVPIMPLLQQSGCAFDGEFFMEIMSKYADEPDLMRLFQAQELPQEQGATENPHTATLPPNTTRSYQRQSIAQNPGVQTQQAAAAGMGIGVGGNPSQNGHAIIGEGGK